MTVLHTSLGQAVVPGSNVVTDVRHFPRQGSESPGGATFFMLKWNQKIY